jgi:glycosyltransferase involved in cell wall biosynthesis
MIPVIGIPYISDFDLLDRCIRSIPPGRYEKIHVIDNSDIYGAIQYPENHKVRITRPHHNIGVAQAWNSIIKWNPQARWWFIVNADTAFSVEDIDRLEAAIRFHDVVTLGGMLAFGVRSSAIAKVGWFDENLHPAYFEDNDWDYRARLLGVHIEKLGPPAEHFGSATIRNSEAYRRQNDWTFPLNRAYYASKWGGEVDHEVYTTPFDKGGSPRDWTLDIARLAQMIWKE